MDIGGILLCHGLECDYLATALVPMEQHVAAIDDHVAENITQYHLQRFPGSWMPLAQDVTGVLRTMVFAALEYFCEVAWSSHRPKHKPQAHQS